MKGFKIFLACTLIISYSLKALAFDVELVTEPRDPIAGESFDIVFKMNIEGSEKPEIEFEASGLDVQKMPRTSSATRTTYLNGKLTVVKEVSYKYEAEASQPGIVFLKNVKIKYKGEVEQAESVPLKIMAPPQEPKLVFLQAELGKKNLYVGEGTVLRYYLYAKANLSTSEIKKYPDLKGFMKRFIPEQENAQRVNYAGEVYIRRQVYSSVVFPEKAGKVVVDPLLMEVSYSLDPFANFGFGFGGQARSKKLSSEPIELTVNELPSQGKPQDFSGLIGKHTFEFSIAKSQIIMNEPVEARLSISGPGNLEAMNEPEIFLKGELEEFDKKVDLTTQGEGVAKKTIDYTFLAKKPGNYVESKIFLNYFDPDEKKYIKVEKVIPPITIAGIQQENKSQGDTSTTEVKRKRNSEVEDQSIQKNFSEMLTKPLQLPLDNVSFQDLGKPLWRVLNHLYFWMGVIVALMGLIGWQVRLQAKNLNQKAVMSWVNELNSFRKTYKRSHWLLLMSDISDQMKLPATEVFSKLDLPQDLRQKFLEYTQERLATTKDDSQEYKSQLTKADLKLFEKSLMKFYTENDYR